MSNTDTKALLHLHFIVLIWGFTAILGKLITIPPVELVFYRTGLAAIGLLIYLGYKQTDFRPGYITAIKFLLTGFVIAAHWITFFASARIANISVCLVGIATCSFWTSLIEPLFTRRRIVLHEVFLGLLMIVGLYVIFRFEFEYAAGLIVAICSAILASIFTVINSKYAKKHNQFVIAFYEMGGATIGIALFFPFYVTWFATSGTLQLIPSSLDWLFLAILAFICTDYAYSASIHLMKRISAFTTNLTVNLEPVYGIILAFLIFGESEKMALPFYFGASVIIFGVLIHPVLNKKFKSQPLETDNLR